MTIALPTREKLSTDPPQTKEEAVFMFEVGEECQRRALRYLVEVADMSYGQIVKLAQQHNPKSRINKDKLKWLASKMKADGEPLKTKVPKNFLQAKRSPVEKSTEPVKNSKPEIEQVQVVVEEPTEKGQPPTQGDAPHRGQPPRNPVPTQKSPSGLTNHSAESVNWADDPCLNGWNGNLNELAQQIYNREARSSRKRKVMAVVLAELKEEIEKTMRAASKSHTIKAGKLLETDVKAVEATLQKEKRPGIKETLEAVKHEAERIQKFASEALRLYQLGNS